MTPNAPKRSDESVVLPCGDPPPTFEVKDGRSLPIGLGPYPGLSPQVWCNEHGWVTVSDEQFAAVKEHFGGTA